MKAMNEGQSCQSSTVPGHKSLQQAPRTSVEVDTYHNTYGFDDGDVEEMGASEDEDGEDDDDDEEEAVGLVYNPAPEGHCKLRPSNWNNIPSTVFVDYPPELGRVRDDVSIIEPLGARKLLYSSHWERVCIKHAFLRSGFTKTSTKAWTCLWSKHQNDNMMKGLNCLQKVNHFQASWCIGRKDRLARTIQAMYRKHGDEFNFHPQSYILPAERDALHRHISNEAKTPGGPGKDLWIKKPCASSCGQGIAVLTGSQVTSLGKSKKLLVQKYVADPYLIDGNKFDLRLYVVITGVDPLRVYIFKEGLTRISTSKYSLKNIGDRFAHLTNYSINKKSKEFKRSMANDGDIDIKTLDFESLGQGAAAEEGKAGGGVGEKDGKQAGRSYKWSYSEFKNWLARKESPEVAEAAHKRIHDLLVKTMIASESVITPHLHSSANYRTNCFELFGCDVMLDSKLKPHLVEVNISPSLMGGAAVDKLIKGQLIADILHTVGTYPHDPKLLKKYDDKDSGKKALNSVNRLASAKHSRPSSAGGSSTSRGSGSCEPQQNPFAFGSMTKMMAAQDAWRRKPEPANISMGAIGANDAVWIMLLMIDDEFKRAETTQLIRAHPVVETATHYNKLYFSSRFSDQLLAKWLIEGGATGAMYNFVPDKFLPYDQLQRRREMREGEKRAGRTRELIRGLRPKLRKGHSADARVKVASPSKSVLPNPPSEDPRAVGPRPGAPQEGASRSKEKSPSKRVQRVKGEDGESEYAPANQRDYRSPTQRPKKQIEGLLVHESGKVSPERVARGASSIITTIRAAQQAGQQPASSTPRPSSMGADLTDEEESSSAPSGGGSESGSNCEKEKEKEMEVDPISGLLSRADKNLGDDADIQDAKREIAVLRARAKENELARDRMVRGLDQPTHPVLKGRDLDFRQISGTTGKDEDPLAVMRQSSQPPAPLGTKEAKGRGARHLRMTVMMQRQLDERGMTKGDSLIAHPPRGEAGARRSSGVKFRSRSSAPSSGKV